MTKIANTDLDVFPLCLGGNVFGWTAEEERSFAVLDAYADAGGNFIDLYQAHKDDPGTPLEDISVVPYFGLAKGFLTGKYRPGGPSGDSPRAEGALAYLDDRGVAVPCGPRRACGEAGGVPPYGRRGAPLSDNVT
jgi:aryl-alcohol dehydrogenase-like predicted oxidoreductase